MSGSKLVILDRDGVINEDSEHYIKDADEWVAIPGSLAAIAKLHNAGYTISVATNQSGIGRGLFDEFALARIHGRMIEAIEDAGGHIEMIAFCPHTPDGACACRKPKPGLLLRISEELGMPLDGVPVIGDSARDLDAARAVGARPLLVRTGKGHATEQLLPAHHEIPVYDDLAAAVTALLTAADPKRN